MIKGNGSTKGRSLFVFIPMTFAEELHSAFGGRFRIRWSDKQHLYQVEQRISHGTDIEPPTDINGDWDTYDDDYIRARDGYFLIMSITAGDRMDCPVCHAKLEVPICETRMMHCRRCELMGFDGRYIAAYYPLNHILIEHLKDIDPDRDGIDRVKKRIRAKDLERNERDQKYRLDEAEAELADDHAQAFKHPLSGYGPKSRDGHRLDGKQ